MKNKLNEAYEAKNLNPHQVKVLNSLRTNLLDNINKTVKELDTLKSAVQLFGGSFDDFLNISIEKQDTIAKYSTTQEGNSYTLPGVFSSSAGVYDLQVMRKDNERMLQLKNLHDVADHQRDAYFKMIVRAQNEMRIYLGNLVRINNEIDSYLEQIAESNSWTSSKQTKKF